MLLFLVAAGGCGGGSREEQGKAPAAEKPAVKNVILATTTSTVDTGLLDVLVPKFEKQTGYRVKVIAVGTGQALAMGERGEADVLLVHAPAAERELVDAGIGVNYRLVMHNDFVIVGPPGDPAGVKGKSSVEAFKAIAVQKALFVSRGDDSGTHKKELAVWKEAGITPAGNWYHESGQGMGSYPPAGLGKKGIHLDRPRHLPGAAGKHHAHHSFGRGQVAAQHLPRDAGQPGEIR